MATRRHRIVSLRMLLVCVILGVALAIVSVVVPVGAVWRWPNDPATQHGPMSWYVDVSELEPGGVLDEPNRDVLIYQTRFGGIVEEHRVVPDGVNVLLQYDFAQRFAVLSRQERERARRRAIERGNFPPPQLPVVPRPPQTTLDRTPQSRALLQRLSGDTAFVRSGWPWRAGEGLDFPVRPVWSGLLANTLFYAVLTLVPVLAWRCWRRWSERRGTKGLSMAGRRHRIVSRGVMVKSGVVGLVLAMSSVPVAATVMSVAINAQQQQRQQAQTPQPAPDYKWISTQESLVGFYRTDLPGGVVWFSLAMEPNGQFVNLADRYSVIDAADDPRPLYARPDYPGYMHGYSYRACGWPRPAAEGRFVINNGPSQATSVSRYERMYVVSFAGQDAQIPLRPIWLGVLANTLFYTVLTLPVLAAGRWWRTRHRRKKQRCVACGYELSEPMGACSECGLGSVPSS